MTQFEILRSLDDVRYAVFSKQLLALGKQTDGVV